MLKMFQQKRSSTDTAKLYMAIKHFFLLHSALVHPGNLEIARSLTRAPWWNGVKCRLVVKPE